MRVKCELLRPTICIEHHTSVSPRGLEGFGASAATSRPAQALDRTDDWLMWL
jgi:hypothetical protein